MDIEKNEVYDQTSTVICSVATLTELLWIECCRSQPKKDVVLILIDLGADMNLRRNDQTLLHQTYSQNPECVSWLLTKGADPNIMTDGKFFFETVQDREIDLEIIYDLKRLGFDFHKSSTSGKSLIDHVLQYGSDNILECLIDLGLDISIKILDRKPTEKIINYCIERGYHLIVDSLDDSILLKKVVLVDLGYEWSWAKKLMDNGAHFNNPKTINRVHRDDLTAVQLYPYALDIALLHFKKYPDIQGCSKIDLYTFFLSISTTETILLAISLGDVRKYFCDKTGVELSHVIWWFSSLVRCLVNCRTPQIFDKTIEHFYPLVPKKAFEWYTTSSMFKCYLSSLEIECRVCLAIYRAQNHYAMKTGYVPSPDAPPLFEDASPNLLCSPHNFKSLKYRTDKHNYSQHASTTCPDGDVLISILAINNYDETDLEQNSFERPQLVPENYWMLTARNRRILLTLGLIRQDQTTCWRDISNELLIEIISHIRF